MIDPNNPHYGEAGAVYGAVYYSAGAPVNPEPKTKKLLSEIKQNLSRLNPSQLIALAETQAALMAPAAPLQAAGYQLANAAPTPAPPLGQVLNLAVTMGDADGTLDLACDPLAGAKTYEWQVTAADPVAGPYATTEQTTASKATLTGRTSGSRVWVRVRGVGPKGPGPWSDPATKIVP